MLKQTLALLRLLPLLRLQLLIKVILLRLLWQGLLLLSLWVLWQILLLDKRRRRVLKLCWKEGSIRAKSLCWQISWRRWWRRYQGRRWMRWKTQS